MNQPAKIKHAKFNIGNIVVHKNQLYNAVIIDIDPIFQASPIYNPLVEKYHFATANLWYRLLVDNSSQETYVRESLLKLSPYNALINHPEINNYLELRDGKYVQVQMKH